MHEPNWVSTSVLWQQSSDVLEVCKIKSACTDIAGYSVLNSSSIQSVLQPGYTTVSTGAVTVKSSFVDLVCHSVCHGASDHLSYVDYRIFVEFAADFGQTSNLLSDEFCTTDVFVRLSDCTFFANPKCTYVCDVSRHENRVASHWIVASISWEYTTLFTKSNQRPFHFVWDEETTFDIAAFVLRVVDPKTLRIAETCCTFVAEQTSQDNVTSNVRISLTFVAMQFTRRLCSSRYDNLLRCDFWCIAECNVATVDASL